MFFSAGMLIDRARKHKEEIAQSIEILHWKRADRWLPLHQPYHSALGPSADGTGQMQGGPGGCASRQNKIFQRRQKFLQMVNCALKTLDVGGCNTRKRKIFLVAMRCRQIGTKHKEPLLDAAQQAIMFGLHPIGTNKTQQAVQLVDRPITFDAGRILCDPLSTEQPCRTIIARLGIYLHIFGQ